MSKAKVLFLDDQPSARLLFVRSTDSQRYDVVTAANVVEAEDLMVHEAPDVIITDLRMPEVDGLEGLARFRRIDPNVPVILITAFGSVKSAVQAMRRGAFDYIRKPFEQGEIEVVIDRAVRHRNLLRENARLRRQVGQHVTQESIVYRSAAMQQAVDLVRRVAPTDHSVLITGASGTGKDLFAGLIHEWSERKTGPFVSLNCSAISEQLLESELFGHEKGAFSGAAAAKAGFLAKADGGTLFLDEIGDMSLNLQPKLLRALQDGEYYAVGSRTRCRADVRVVCASNQDLPAAVESKRFREDLFYRINTVTIALPALRDRTEDIPPLVNRFLDELSAGSAAHRHEIHPSTMRHLVEYGWPGNVRELKHALARASVVCDGDTIMPDHLAREVRGSAPLREDVSCLSYREAKSQLDRSYFTRLLAQAGGNVQKAAELAGIHRTTLYDKLTKLGIRTDRD